MMYILKHKTTGELLEVKKNFCWPTKEGAKKAYFWGWDKTHWKENSPFEIVEVKFTRVTNRQSFEDWLQEETIYGPRIDRIKHEIGPTDFSALQKWLRLVYTHGYEQGGG